MMTHTETLSPARLAAYGNTTLADAGMEGLCYFDPAREDCMIVVLPSGTDPLEAEYLREQVASELFIATRRRFTVEVRYAISWADAADRGLIELTRCTVVLVDDEGRIVLEGAPYVPHGPAEPRIGAAWIEPGDGGDQYILEGPTMRFVLGPLSRISEDRWQLDPIETGWSVRSPREDADDYDGERHYWAFGSLGYCDTMADAARILAHQITRVDEGAPFAATECDAHLAADMPRCRRCCTWTGPCYDWCPTHDTTSAGETR